MLAAGHVTGCRPPGRLRMLSIGEPGPCFFRWHGTAHLRQRSPFFAGKVLGACCASLPDHLPPTGRADIEQPCFCYRLAQVVMVGGRLLHEAQGRRTPTEHQWEADLLLSSAMNFQQACQPRPDLIQR